jgi:NTE family protein
MIPPRHIVLSGGGVKVISLVGALEHLEEKGHLRSVKEYCGVSAGAFLAFMMALQIHIKTIRTLILELDFGVIRNLTPEGLIGFPETFGLDDGTNLVKFLESILRVAVKVDPSITFADLQKRSPVRFRCWAGDLIAEKPREFSFEATPTVRIVDALRASMSLPFYYCPVPDPITGNLLTDGGIHGNLPVALLSESERETMLALGFGSDSEADKTDGFADVLVYMNKVLLCLIQGRNKEVYENWSHKICRISIDHYPSWNFELSRDDRVMLLGLGKITIEKWLTTSYSVKQKTAVLRRYSV